jgi:hypothetical protein
MIALSLSLITTKWIKIVFVWMKKTSNTESKIKKKREEKERIMLKNYIHMYTFTSLFTYFHVNTYPYSFFLDCTYYISICYTIVVYYGIFRTCLILWANRFGKPLKNFSFQNGLLLSS